MWGAFEYRSATSDINASILASRLRALFAFMTTPLSQNTTPHACIRQRLRKHRARGRRRRAQAALFRPLHRGYQARVRVNGLPLPPQPLRPQLEDRKMQVWRARIRISRRSHKTDDVSTLDPHSLTQPVRVTVQVRVVVAIHFHFVELVYRVAARFAEEKLAHDPRYHCTHGCPSRFQNIDPLMGKSVVNFIERIPQIREGESVDGRSHVENGRGRANREKHWQQPGNANPEPQRYSSRTTGVPRRTMCDSSSTSQFVNRIHPSDSNWDVDELSHM